MLIIIIVTVHSGSAMPNSTELSASVSASPLVFKYLAYNILDDGLAPGYNWIQVAKEENADILVLSEAYTWNKDNDKLLKDNIQILNNYFIDEDPYEGYAAQSQEGDCAILSRFPIINATDVTSLTLDIGTQFKPYRDFLHAVVDIKGIEVHIFGNHLKCCGELGGPEESLRERDQEGLINYLDNIGSVPIIYSGDFNSYSPMDIGDLEASTPNLGSGPINMLLNNSDPHASTLHSWVDVFRELNPTHPGYSYVDWMYQSRIDFIFGNDFFFDKLINSTVANSPSREPSESSLLGSDHYPVDAFFNMEPSIADLRPPNTPTGLSGSVLSQTSFNLTWIPNTEFDFSHYVIYREDYELAQTTSSHFLDTSLLNGVHYPYRIVAIDINGNIGFSSEKLIVETSYGICTKPVAPQLAGYPGNDMTTLIWNIADDGGLPIIEYRIYREFETQYRTIYKPQNTVPGNTLGYLDTLNYNGNPGIWTVTAVNVLGESDYSNSVTVTPDAAADPMPQIPSTTIIQTVPGSPPTVPTYTTSSTTIDESITSSSDSTTPLPFIFVFFGLLIIFGRRRLG